MNSTKEAMSLNPILIFANTGLLEAYRIMTENNIRHLPVLNELRQVIGILSDRDIQRAMEVHVSGSENHEISINPTLIAEDFMSWPVYTVSIDTSLRRVAEEMLARKVSAFIVQDHESRIAGIITTDDILKTFVLNNKENDIGMKSIAHYFTGPEIY